MLHAAFFMLYTSNEMKSPHPFSQLFMSDDLKLYCTPWLTAFSQSGVMLRLWNALKFMATYLLRASLYPYKGRIVTAISEDTLVAFLRSMASPWFLSQERSEVDHFPQISNIPNPLSRYHPFDLLITQRPSSPRRGQSYKNTILSYFWERKKERRRLVQGSRLRCCCHQALG